MSMFVLLTVIIIPIIVGIVHRILTRDDWFCGPEMSVFLAFMTAVVIAFLHLSHFPRNVCAGQAYS